MKLNWNGIQLDKKISEFPIIELNNGCELQFEDFEDYRSFVMTLVGMISAGDKLPYEIILKPKQ